MQRDRRAGHPHGAGGPAEHLHASDHGKRGHDTQFLIRERTCDALVSLDPRLGKIGAYVHVR